MSDSRTVTIDELIKSLRDEWQALEDKYFSAFERLGRVLFNNKTGRNCWPVDEAIGQIEKMQSRQHEISTLIEDIERAAAKVEKVEP